MRGGLWEWRLARLVVGLVASILRALALLFAGALWVVTTLVAVIFAPVLREPAFAVGRARAGRRLAGGAPRFR